MDALMLLTADHNRVRGLFTRFETAKESKDVAQMTELAALIATELQVHAAIEEEILYPWAQELGDEIKEIITEAYEEHKVANDLVAEITSMTPDAESWAAKVTVLMENVEHHAEEEEKELFPKLRRATDATGLRVLAEQLEERKEELKAEMAPAASTH